MSKTALLHAVLMVEPGQEFTALCGKAVELNPSWDRWADAELGTPVVFIRCPDCLVLYPLDSN